MALEHLIVCLCGHDIERHDAGGCTVCKEGERCACRLARDAVLDSALNVERDEIRRQWLPAEPHE